MVPRSTDKKIKQPGGVWETAVVERQTAINGGFCNKSHLIDTIQVGSGGTTDTFVHVRTYNSLVCKIVAGVAVDRTILSRSTILDRFAELATQDQERRR